MTSLCAAYVLQWNLAGTLSCTAACGGMCRVAHQEALHVWTNAAVAFWRTRLNVLPRFTKLMIRGPSGRRD